MDEFTALINERRRKAECEALGIAYVPDVVAVRDAIPCDQEVPTVPDVLFGPNNPPPPAFVERDLPPPLLVNSPAYTLTCTEGDGSVTIAYGTTNALLYLDEITQLTRSELYRVPLDGRLQALQDALDANLESLAAGSITADTFDTAVRTASSMGAEAAVGFRELALRLRGGPPIAPSQESTGLYAVVAAIASSQLVCTFYSAEVCLVCDSSVELGYRVTTPTQPYNVNCDAYRPVGSETSTISQLDADEQAVLDAARSLSCLYRNEEISVYCSDLDAAFAYDYDPPFSYPVGSINVTADSLDDLGSYRRFDALTLNSYATVFEGLNTFALDSLAVKRELVSRITVAADLFTATTQEEANTLATDWALLRLNCFFPSRAREWNCNNREPDPAKNPVAALIAGGMSESDVFTGMDSEYGVDKNLVTNSVITTVGNVAVVDVSLGLIVDLPPGVVSSLSNQEEADEEARLYALNFLSCLWVSPAVECSCSDVFSESEIQSFDVYLNTDLSITTQSFAKGALGTSADGPIAVSSLRGLCESALSCVYCNNTREPQCSVAYDNGLPYELWNPPTDEGLPISLLNRNGVSTGVTAGLPAGIICDSDPRTIKTIADSTAALPPLVNSVVGPPTCLYGNRELTRTCEEKVGDLAYGLAPESQGRTITVAAGSFEAVSQVEADALAFSFINASLICEFGNPPMTILCGATTRVNTIDPVEYTDGVIYGDGQNVALDAIGGISTPLVLEAHQYFSLESPLNAKSQALLALVTQLDCFWQSARIEMMCSAPPVCPRTEQLKNENEVIIVGANEEKYCEDSVGSSAGEVVVESKEVTSYTSQEDANRAAYAVAQSFLDCFWQSARIDLMCDAPSVCPTNLRSKREFESIEAGSNVKNYCPDSNGDLPGEVFLDAKTIESRVSQSAANVEAYAITVSQLDCFWQNAGVSLLCGAPLRMPSVHAFTDENGSISEGDNTAEPPVEPLGSSTYSSASKGFRRGDVVVNNKDIVSYTSQSDANSQAYLLAVAQLDCFWNSAEVVISCRPPRFLNTPQKLTGEDGTITGGRSMTGGVQSPSGAISSYQNQAAANVEAYNALLGQLECGPNKTHAFGLSGGGGGGGGGGNDECCEITIDAVAQGFSKYYEPLQAGSGLTNNVPGFDELLVEANITRCISDDMYVYLDVTLGKRSPEDNYSHYYGRPEVVVSSMELPIIEGVPGDYTRARRLVAFAKQNGPSDSSCEGLEIVQLVTKPQQMTSAFHEGAWVPSIHDLGSAGVPVIRPPAFTLRPCQEGNSISAEAYIGALEYNVTVLRFKRFSVGNGKRVNGLVSQDAIEGVIKINLESPQKEANNWCKIDWIGDIWAAWDVDPATGIPSALRLEGPSKPTDLKVSQLPEDLIRGGSSGGTYSVKIGSIDPTGFISQERSGNIIWDITFVPNGESEPSGSQTSGDSSSSSSSTSIGSSKDTAIDLDQDGNYRKWYAMEATEVLFFDFQTFYCSHGKNLIELDPVLLFSCEKDSLCAFVSPDVGNANAEVLGGYVSIKSRFTSKVKKQKVQVMLKGVRRGFAKVRLQYATFEDFVDNECRLNPRMTRSEIIEKLGESGVKA